MAHTALHVRSETKDLERRSALSPASVKALLQEGYQINIERSSTRCYQDTEFEQAGATLVPEGSWERAPTDHIITGLKELPEASSPLNHAHIQFGHCYKQQDGWEKYLSRFARGNGLLYDIEFLTDDETGRRVAAFGYHAGYAGAAISLLAWAHQVVHPDGPPLGAIPTYPSAGALVDSVKSNVSSIASQQQQQYPRVLIIGALGRCGTGAVDFCHAAGIPDSCILKWDIAETSRGGPFREISTADIFINCVYVDSKNPIPPFVTRESLSVAERRLRVICDVSCDPNSEHNPVPVCTDYSTFREPTLPVDLDGDGPGLAVVSIDHLPSLVAREASDEFAKQLLPSLQTLSRRYREGVWTRAERLYREKVKDLPVDA